MTKEEYLNSDFVKMAHLNNQVVCLTQINRKIEKENKQLKAQIEKMKNCWNCKYYNVGETTCLKGKPHNSGGCFKDWELAE